MSAISKSLARMDSLYSNAQMYALSEKRKSGNTFIDPFTPSASGLGYRGNHLQGASESRYAHFRGWVYAAVNALAMSGASQPVRIGKIADKYTEKNGNLNRLKSYQRKLMPGSVSEKAADAELEIILDHSMKKCFEQPNSVQHRWQFTYSFIANLCLTGWSFVVSGLKEGSNDEYEFYSIPSTWVRPDHSKGAFQEFYIVNPRDSTVNVDAVPLTRDQVDFTYLPNPADPLEALSPAGAQLLGIKVDDYIQESQHNFFKNGIFPSVLVTVGKDPHPDVPGGIRPRLTPAQRRQVHGAIRKVMGGVENYGEPAILDGFIESIERISATQTEMGWEKSEKTVRTRILSAFGVHPFILGEEMAGSYAQAYIVESRFNERVNTYLEMLSNMMTGLAAHVAGEELLVWWENRVARAPDMEKAMYEGARAREDISQNEFRAYMGMPPDEDGNESVLPKTSIQAVSGIAASVVNGAITPEQGIGILKEWEYLLI